MRYLSIILFLYSGIIFSQTQKDTTSLKEVKLKTSVEMERDYQQDAKVSLLNQEELLQSNQTTITPILNKIPEVYMQQGGINTTKINIRGIEAIRDGTDPSTKLRINQSRNRIRGINARVSNHSSAEPAEVSLQRPKNTKRVSM